MIEIIPAVLDKNFREITKRLDQISMLTKTVQIDICDGSFVPSVSWPFISPVAPEKTLNYDEGFRALVADEKEMPHWDEFDFEIDLMVHNVKRILSDLMAIGPTRVIFHAESFVDLNNELYDACMVLPTIVEPVIAISAETNPEIIFGILDEGIVKAVQCMGIAHEGYQGQSFDEKVITNLRTLRARYPKLPLSVDGAVTLETAKRLVEAGANRLVVGSAIFTAPDIEKRIAEFNKLVV